MTAPVLLMVAQGGVEPGVARVVHDLRTDVEALRPQVRAHVAFLEQTTPSLAATIDRLVKDGVPEIALVPLELAVERGAEPARGAARPARSPGSSPGAEPWRRG